MVPISKIISTEACLVLHLFQNAKQTKQQHQQSLALHTYKLWTTVKIVKDIRLKLWSTTQWLQSPNNFKRFNIMCSSVIILGGPFIVDKVDNFALSEQHFSSTQQHFSAGVRKKWSFWTAVMTILQVLMAGADWQLLLRCLLEILLLKTHLS